MGETTTTPNEENVCALCNIVARKRCSNCHEVYYCSREHQKSHWKTHSKNCQPCKVAVNSQVGRHYIATRDIKAGEVVIHDKRPLVTGLYSCDPVCLNCYEKLSRDNARPCGNCGWPLCRNCTNHGAECEFTMKYRKTKVEVIEYGKPFLPYKTIVLVRALALRETDPDAYRRLLDFEDHCFEIATQPNILDPPETLACFMQSFFNFKGVPETEIAKIAAIVQINGHWVGNLTSSHIAVYGKSNYVEHNCRSNCSKTFTADGGIIYWAAVPISKGDHISISYVDFRFGTMKRRQHLASTKFFDCICERCKDPTEFGTMFSAFKCFKDGCNGFMLPPTFIVSENFPDFVCRECNAKKSWEFINNMEQELYGQLSTILDTALTPDSLLNASKKSIEKYGNILHENHCFKFAFDIDELSSYLYNMDDLADQSLNDGISRCKNVIKLLEILEPSEHRIRAQIMFLQHRFSTHALRKKQNKAMKIYAGIPPFITESKKILEKVCELLRREPTFGPVENKIAEVALEEVQNYHEIEKEFVSSKFVKLQL